VCSFVRNRTAEARPSLAEIAEPVEEERRVAVGEGPTAFWGERMKKLMSCAFLTTILGLAVNLEGASSVSNLRDLATAKSTRVDGTEKPTVQREVTKAKIAKSAANVKSVPAPPMVLLLSVAAGIAWGVRRLWPHRRPE